jgi:hypothetical protein
MRLITLGEIIAKNTTLGKVPTKIIKKRLYK